MKIGIVLSNTPGYSETFFNSKIKGLQENGMEVRLYCQTKKDDFTLCPIIESPKVSRNAFLQTWYFIKEFLLLMPYLLTVFRYIKLERNEGTGIIQIFKKIYLNAHLLKAKLDWLHFGFATMALGSETVAKAIEAKMAVSFRGFDIAVFPVKNPGCYKTLWKYVDKVHTISNDLLVLAKRQGLPETIPVEKITPAIDVNLFQSTNQNIDTSEKIVFMTTGRLHWKKGFVATIEALALLKSKGLDFTYKIIGEGPEYERIAFAAYQLGLKDNVQFLGKLPHSEVKRQLESATMYLQYSIQEGFCNAVLEAQAMGKLCIVSNAEGLPENVIHNQTGWVVPKYNPQALVETIQKVIALNPEEKIAISETAQKRVKEEFNIVKQQREFLNFYSSLDN
ncbi:glycosyltransferase family 4 protein [Aequorivita lipolytica]|uniref:Glycosyltransferase family 4 protein n=1 Tax=Aequorivita lipolytica TaxID=153267 RepID=A0A5C6YP37_9FLAO|nr:glycosyltransferase family 4 protein [Aequorivita lipolytica]TXD68803.1 glycosyltransferase family 4 protein [Aequorivita lipolytica]SRX52054.1 2-deoxystreptamine glucosyltransferase [Aequorivita lipolytica]